MDNVDYIPSLRSTCIQGQKEEKKARKLASKKETKMEKK